MYIYILVSLDSKMSAKTARNLNALAASSGRVKTKLTKSGGLSYYIIIMLLNYVLY